MSKHDYCTVVRAMEIKPTMRTFQIIFPMVSAAKVKASNKGFREDVIMLLVTGRILLGHHFLTSSALKPAW